MGATYRRRGRNSWEIVVHRNRERAYQTVHGSKADVMLVVRELARLEATGHNLIDALRLARQVPIAPTPAPTFSTLREALTDWISRQELAQEIRSSTAKAYRSRLATWVYPHTLADGRVLGDLTVDVVTREMIGGVIRRVKESGKSLAIIEGIRNPLRGYFADLIENKAHPGPNPASDLKHFIGKGLHRRKKIVAFFAQEEGPALVSTAAAAVPRWHAFILTGLLAGLRWGEAAALHKTDIDWKRERIHVQRTFSE